MLYRISGEAFKTGELTGLKYDGGELSLSSSAEGVFDSAVTEAPPFSTLIVSFNADIPEGTDVEIKASVRVDGEWSLFFSYGRFSPYILRAGTIEEDSLARMAKEQINLKNGLTADAFRVKAILRSSQPGKTPYLRLLTATHKPFPASQPERRESFYETPRVSQLVRSPNMCQVICSTTSVTMLLNRLGEDILPEETALFDYDHVFRGNGNWVYSCAIAACYGYEAYVEYTDVEGLKQELAEGHPLVARVRYSSVYEMGAEEDIPYVGNTPGLAHAHLIAVVGFTCREGKDYLIVQDPYALSNEATRRLYRVEEFEKGWNNIIYKIHEKRPGAGKGKPVRIPAELKQVKPDCYELYADGKRVELGAYFIGSQKFPRGAVVIIPDGEEAVPICSRTAYYADTDGEGFIHIDPEYIKYSDSRRAFTIYIISVYGKTYVAPLNIG